MTVKLLTPEGKAAIKGSTTEHTQAGIGALLVGWSCATFRTQTRYSSIRFSGLPG